MNKGDLSDCTNKHQGCEKSGHRSCGKLWQNLNIKPILVLLMREMRWSLHLVGYAATSLHAIFDLFDLAGGSPTQFSQPMTVSFGKYPFTSFKQI